MDKLARKIEIPLAKEAVRKAGLYLVPKERFGELAEVAMDAYVDYPLHNWFSGGEYDPKASRLIMEITLKTMKEEGVVYADSEQLNGFAVWLPPTYTGIKAIPFLRKGGLELICHSGLGIVGRLLSYESFAMRLKEKHTGHAEWYLYNLSVARKAQRQGIAFRLMRPMLEFYDREKIGCYLETNKEGNVPIYERLGFRVAEQARIPGSDVMHYAMTRVPRDVREKKVEDEE